MKKINNFFISFSIIAVSFQFTSCKKYLDEKPSSNLVVPATIDDLQALMDYTDRINIATPIYMEVTADDYFVTDATYNGQSQMDRDAYTWKPFEYSHYNDWAACYYPVYIGNLALETLEKIPETSLNKGRRDNVKGSALFLRSYFFLKLAWQHAKAWDEISSETDPGIPLRQNSDFNLPYPRATVKQTYEQIIADAKESINYLPNTPQHVMRPSKAAAYGLLARTYLSMRKYDSAFKYADLSLSVKNNLLNYNIASEVVITAPYPFKKFNSETIFYTESFNAFLFIAYNAYSQVDTMLYTSFANNDLRKTAYFSPKGNYQIFKGSYTEDGRFFTGLATNEMYLTRAECYARLGDKTSALNDLNTLLQKRYNATFVPITASDANDALAKILAERRKELMFRGLRWMDLKRLNKGGANITLKRIILGQTYLLSPNDNKYALPLPKDIVDQGIAQNPQ